MTERVNQVGFSQRVRLEWMEAVADMASKGFEKAAVFEAMQDILRDKVSVGGEAERGNREKIITILMKTWIIVPNELVALRDDGLNLLSRLPQHDRLAIHWGMVSAAYPFWAAVATQTGRLLRLQGTASAVHVQRRVREQYGERETVSRAARRVLRSFMDWGVLLESGAKGTYISASPRVTLEPALIAWLIESSLYSRANNSAPLSELFDSPGMFPFQVKPIHAEFLLATARRLEIIRHGLNDELVVLSCNRGETANP